MKKSKQVPLIDMHKFVVEQLRSRKGDWKNISESTGVPYFTISKIASGVTGDPRISSCQRLADYFNANPKPLAA
mgnify:CR=1 FL=1|tara:strand:- start:10997 stop:11218 length:222 start_codon:yes stop_codon:yes gene_type:complete